MEVRSGGPSGRDGREDLSVLTLLFGLDPTAAPANPTPPPQELSLWSDIRRLPSRLVLSHPMASGEKTDAMVDTEMMIR